MIIVERHFRSGTPEIIQLCSTSKELYNKCNFYIRQSYFNNKPLPSLNELTNIVIKEDCFKNLHNTKTAKQTIRKVLTDWSNYFKALKAYKKDPSKFKKYPKPPYYKKKMAQVIFYNETIKKKPLKEGNIVPTNYCFNIKSDKNFKQVIITPKTFGFIIEVQYDQEVKKCKVDKEKVLNIDLGVDNLASITSNQHNPILINGRILKSINQWFNKHPNKRNSKKRYFRIENYFHNASKFIIDLCIYFHIGTIIIGRNEGWKQRVKIRSKNKQNFQYIPFDNFINKIEYKAKLCGIKVIYTEESYTSKASFIDRDVMPVYGEEKGEINFSGNRIHRGLYKTKDGLLINADVNGSANIGRKVIQDPEFLRQLDRSLAARPITINPLKVHCGLSNEWLSSLNINSLTSFCKF